METSVVYNQIHLLKEVLVESWFPEQKTKGANKVQIPNEAVCIYFAQIFLENTWTHFSLKL